MEVKVKIFCRSFDLRLYSLSKALYASLGYPVVRLTDQSADGYFYTMLRDTDCDIAVNIDEDAFLVDPSALQELIETVVSEGYANAGCPDGNSEGVPRAGNPTITNPFFNILDLRQIRAGFDKSLLKREDCDLEPYYPFFRWMAGNYKILYLTAKRHSDGISTILYSPQGREICYHSWFARFYSMPSWAVRFAQKDKGRQKLRIDALIKEAYAKRGMEIPAPGICDEVRFTIDKIVRWTIKIPQRVAGWPRKIAKKIRLRRAA